MERKHALLTIGAAGLVAAAFGLGALLAGSTAGAGVSAVTPPPQEAAPPSGSEAPALEQPAVVVQPEMAPPPVVGPVLPSQQPAQPAAGPQLPAQPQSPQTPPAPAQAPPVQPQQPPAQPAQPAAPLQPPAPAAPQPPAPQAEPPVLKPASPRVEEATPAGESIGVARRPKLSVRFSEAMDKTATQAAFSITQPMGFNQGTFSWDASGKVMSFMPDASFDYGTVVEWGVSTQAASLAGAAMKADFGARFRVLRLSTSKLYSQAGLDGSVYAPPVAVLGSKVNTNAASIEVGTWRRGFVSFDLSPLPADLVKVTAAGLAVYQDGHDAGAYGPQTGKLLVQSASYGSALDVGDFSLAAHQFCWPGCVPLQVVLSAVAADGWKTADVTAFLQGDWNQRGERGQRSQMRLRFEVENAGAGPDVGASFSAGDAAAHRPLLEVTYEHP